MITKDQAKQIAVEHLATTLPSEVVVLDGSTIEKPYGWVFLYDSKAFVEGGDPDDQLFGNAPILVLRESGKMHFLPTAHPPKVGLEMFEEEHGIVV